MQSNAGQLGNMPCFAMLCHVLLQLSGLSLTWDGFLCSTSLYPVRCAKFGIERKEPNRVANCCLECTLSLPQIFKNWHFRALSLHSSSFYLFRYLRLIRCFHILLSIYLTDKNSKVEKSKASAVKVKTSDSIVANNVWRNLINEHGVQHMDRKLPIVTWHLAAQETSLFYTTIQAANAVPALEITAE